MSTGDLPGWARRVLAATLPEDWRDDIVRDLEEAWQARRRARGWVRAHTWLGVQTVAFALRFLPDRLTERLRGAVASTDVKLALRSVRRTPFMALLSVISLSIGIGAAVTGFTALEGVLFTGLPFPDGDRIRLVADYNVTGRFTVEVRAEEFLRRRERLESFDMLAAYTTRALTVGEEAAARVERVVLGSFDLLHVTGVAPMMGRLPDEGDVRPGAEPVVVLPHRAWVSHLSADPGAIGATLEIGGSRRTVIGVMPDGFGFPFVAEIWIPIDPRDVDGPLSMVGRLAQGSDVDAARAELAAVAAPDPTQVGADDEIAHLVMSPTRPVTDDLQLLLVAVPVLILTLLLLVMATNVANLVLARNATRASELAVRSALGGSRGRIVGQLGLEVALLVGVSAALGVWMSQAALTAFFGPLENELPFWSDFSLSAGTVGFAVLLAGLVTLVAGLLPARRAVAAAPNDALREGGRGGASVRFGRITGALIVVQVGICVGFLGAATLLGQSLASFDFERYGLPASETLVAQLYFGFPTEVNDPAAGTSDARRDEILARFYAEVERKQSEIRDAVLELPGARLAAYGTRFPGNESDRVPIEIEDGGRPVESVEVAEVGPRYLELLGAGVLRGRAFTAEEHAGGASVALVNEPFERERLGGASAVGRRVRAVPPAAAGREAGPWMTIVGVVPDLGMNPGNPTNAATLYQPLDRATFVRLAVRGEGALGSWSPALVEIVRRIDPAIQVQASGSLANQLRDAVMLFRTMGLGFLLLGGIALLLSAASIHALTSCTVSGRAKELGIRQALGASSSSIVGTVMRRSAFQLGAGLLLGLGLTTGLLRIASQFPWEIRQGNPAALGLVVGVLVVSGALALTQPLRRALSIRPADAMRSE